MIRDPYNETALGSAHRAPAGFHLLTEYPAIAARAKREGAEIQRGDETSLKASDPRGRGFAPRGQTPGLASCGG